MSNFSRPLVALSLTEHDKSLLDYAALLLERFEWSDTHFAHVASEDPQRWEQPLQDEVRQYFGERAARAESLHAVEGTRLDQILRLAVECERDLIVLGHRRMRSGRRGLARRLAMVSPASVWLVPEGAAAKLSNILVPIDFSDHSADALAVAVGIARAAGIDRLQAIHVFFDPSTIRYDEHVKEVAGQEKAAFDEFMAEIDTQGIEVEPIFVEGTRPAQDILRTAERCGTDLIVLNTRGRSKAASVLLGSTTSETMTATTVPVLAVKHFGGRMTLLEALVNHRIWERPSPKTN